jgi:nucleotide-binding universal stress UspA family protein
MDAQRIEHIVIPVDLAHVSVAAIDHARWMAARLHVGTTLLSAADRRHLDVTRIALRSLADEVTARAAKDADDDHLVPLATEVVRIDPGADIESTLVGELLGDETSLWCVASHGRTALGELWFGSVSADLVRDAQRPVVVVGPHAANRADAEVLLVALDGSEFAEQVIPTALEVADALGMQVRLVQVGTAHVPGDGNDTAYLARIAEDHLDPAHADYDVLVGDAIDALTSYVERTPDVAMVALVTHGVPGPARLVIRSSAMQLVRRSVVPLVVLHPAAPLADAGAESTITSASPTGAPVVVVGVDTHVSSAPALRWAADEAERRGAVLRVVHAWRLPIPVGSLAGGFPVWDDLEACRSAAMEEVARTVDTVTADHADMVIESMIAEGDAASALVTAAEGADLLVVGRHEHGRLAAWVFGSTSEITARNAPCPLVIIPCD